MIPVVDLSKSDNLYKVSDPIIAQENAYKYLGRNATLYKSSQKSKKYAIFNENGKAIHFGDINHQDFTKHGNLQRRINYLCRSKNIKVDWKDNPYSRNNLSRYILWNL